MMNLENLFEKFKEESIAGRYLHNEDIEPILKKIEQDFKINTIGESVLKKPIYTIEFGTGKTKILMWSQMHGNEATTTKAVFDFFNFLKSNNKEVEFFKKEITLLIIPILNPDGAQAYTRENANQIDLNRDAIDLSQPESKILRKLFHDFKPDFCFNLHDQRTVHGVGDTAKPATVSFLAPAYNQNRDINENRLKAINLIAYINGELQNYIPGQIGRFDDEHNNLCVGDTFQSFGIPTILFESGHFPDDYQREITRKYIFISLYLAIKGICEIDFAKNNFTNYMSINQNKPVFSDFIYRNIKINYNSLNILTNFALQYDEVLKNNTIEFQARISEIGDLSHCFGHIEYDCQGAEFSNESGNEPKINDFADFYLDKKMHFRKGVRIF
jgi:Zinc carboxypeptidase